MLLSQAVNIIEKHNLTHKLGAVVAMVLMQAWKETLTRGK